MSYAPIGSGRRRHAVVLQTPTLTPNADGDFTEALAVLGSAHAAIEPATGRDQERVIGGAALGAVTHVVTIPYRAGVTTQTRVLFGTRTLFVRGVANPEERNIELVLLCEEVQP